MGEILWYMLDNIYVCLSSYLMSELTFNFFCVKVIIMTFILWSIWYSDMERSWVLDYEEYFTNIEAYTMKATGNFCGFAEHARGMTRTI